MHRIAALLLEDNLRADRQLYYSRLYTISECLLLKYADVHLHEKQKVLGTLNPYARPHIPMQDTKDNIIEKGSNHLEIDQEKIEQPVYQQNQCNTLAVLDDHEDHDKKQNNNNDKKIINEKKLPECESLKGKSFGQKTARGK